MELCGSKEARHEAVSRDETRPWSCVTREQSVSGAVWQGSSEVVELWCGKEVSQRSSEAVEL